MSSDKYPSMFSPGDYWRLLFIYVTLLWFEKHARKKHSSDFVTFVKVTKGC